jgi:hypothetical protein
VKTDQFIEDVARAFAIGAAVGCLLVWAAVAYMRGWIG